ncbi:MAG: sporulation protein YqfD, partial [Eubacterium sp.]|nr:sporulation protein YqfD [Eubacterium sp.]
LYPYLRSGARRHGGSLRINKKRGLIFYLLPYRNRWGLLVGAVFAVSIICILTSFVWKIEIKSSGSFSASVISELLEENGLKPGALKRSVDKDRLESLLLAVYPECAWAHINENGTVFTVELGDAVLKPDTVNPEEYCNLKAKKDGVIVKATVDNGWQLVRKGEAVCAGDILASGVFESEKKLNLFAHARGEFIAEVKEPVRIKISRAQKEKNYISENQYKYLSFFSLKIPLFLIPRVDGEADENAEYLKLFGGVIPVGVITETVKAYTVTEKSLSDRELLSLAKAELENKLKNELSDCEIIKRNLKTELNGDSITITGNVLVLEDIAEEVKIIK